MCSHRVPFTDPPLEEVKFSDFSRHNIHFSFLRLDKIHSELGGNKYYKLKQNIDHILTLGRPTVVSFGGAYSNHLRALAAAGRIYSFKTIGFVRGEIVRPLNPILKFCNENGMELQEISRENYRLKSSMNFIGKLRSELGDFYLLPEGGSNLKALKGCTEISRLIPNDTNYSLRYITLACGTGLTLSGIVVGATQLERTQAIGFSVLKAPGYLNREVEGYLSSISEEFCSNSLIPWRVEDEYHCGGYAKKTPKLLEFIERFTQETSVPIEPTYTGKMLYGLSQLLDDGGVESNTQVIAIHTGGVYLN